MKFENNVMFTGRLGRDAEVKVTASGKTLIKFSLGNTYKDETTWLDVVVWENEAATNFKKGNIVFVRGFLKQENWEAKDGTKRSRLVCNAQECCLQEFEKMSKPPASEDVEF